VKVVVRDTRWVPLLLLLSGVAPAAAQPVVQPAVRVRVSGTFVNNGAFAGTLTINRFEQRGDAIVAIGVVEGVLARANRTLGTVLATEVAWRVSANAGGGQLAGNSSVGSPGPRIMVARWPATPPAMHLTRVQAQGCTPLQVNVNAQNVDLLGVQVALDPVNLTLTGAAGTPLGDLVCAAGDLVGNVAGLVNVLNNLLGVLIGLLGGVTGGAAGIV
jgi:hypothetical protein